MHVELGSALRAEICEIERLMEAHGGPETQDLKHRLGKVKALLDARDARGVAEQEARRAKRMERFDAAEATHWEKTGDADDELLEAFRAIVAEALGFDEGAWPVGEFTTIGGEGLSTRDLPAALMPNTAYQFNTSYAFVDVSEGGSENRVRINVARVGDALGVEIPLTGYQFLKAIGAVP